jgi:hypothetical protein
VRVRRAAPPVPRALQSGPGRVSGTEVHLGTVHFFAQTPDGVVGEWMFTDNETNYK